jgi:hypothetical protein
MFCWYCSLKSVWLFHESYFSCSYKSSIPSFVRPFAPTNKVQHSSDIIIWLLKNQPLCSQLNTRGNWIKFFFSEQKKAWIWHFFEGCGEQMHYVSLRETIFEKESQSAFSAMHQLISCPEFAIMNAIQRLSMDRSRCSMIRLMCKPWLKR